MTIEEIKAAIRKLEDSYAIHVDQLDEVRLLRQRLDHFSETTMASLHELAQSIGIMSDMTMSPAPKCWSDSLFLSVRTRLKELLADAVLAQEATQ